MYEPVQLDSVSVIRFKELTYPAYQSHLLHISEDNSWIAFGLEIGSNPVGLILAKDAIYEEKKVAEICSLFVIPEYRQRGIGTALLQSLENELIHRSCEKVSLGYLDNPNQVFIEQMLASCHWEKSTKTALICYGNTKKIQNASLLRNFEKLSAKFPVEFSLFPWSNLTEVDVEAIKAKIDTDPLIKKFNPFIESKKLESLNSLGLRYKNEIIGWIITHRIAPDTIRYTQMFVDPAFQPLSRSLIMLATAINIQVGAIPEIPKATFRVDVDNTPMINFVQRRLAPHLDDLKYAWRASKALIA
ncbi:GNAT family N-acetyltransferase [Synechocystis sp. PCC 7339]|uniref:GNAT family N-acetyltransferase n=1 Tax=Synechocystis sp. PCC 7339 TaxID=2782213 RepID=UPI001CBB847D|nr:GNAT family N-acetyltransferase [Synechocystis sp. PCC 7339]UAJ72121.1 GNAT family N-acetyltransferase [Synechocystis sp. PCC 7339]